jgi:1-phosphofructokinase family hexose kinase
VILTVTLNAALDTTYGINGELAPDRTHRVRTIATHAGGKGVNVARVLHSLGDDVIATGLLGGRTGAHVQSLLDAEGVRNAFVGIEAETRRTVAITDAVGTTGLWEAGPAVTAAEWTIFGSEVQQLLQSAEVVVLSGSLPPGVPRGAYADLIGMVRAAGIPAVLDTDGEPLQLGIWARPDLVKPNASELATLVGGSVDGVADSVWAGLIALAMGADAIVVSLGAAGVVLVTADSRLHASLPQPIAGNPTGAGDACTAALARTIGQPWPDRLIDAVALSAASVPTPAAGTVDLQTYRDMRGQISVEEC